MALGQKREKEESKNVEIFFWLTNSKGDLLLLLYEKKGKQQQVQRLRQEQQQLERQH